MRRARARGRRASRQSRRCASAAARQEANPDAGAARPGMGRFRRQPAAAGIPAGGSGQPRPGAAARGRAAARAAAAVVVRARSNPPSVPTTLRFAAYPGGAQDPIAHFGLAPCGAAVSFLAGNLRRCAITVRRVGCLFCAGACHLWQPISGPHILRGGRSFLCRGSSRPLARTAAGRGGADLSVAPRGAGGTARSHGAHLGRHGRRSAPVRQESAGMSCGLLRAHAFPLTPAVRRD